jgi:hypothetical protein
LRDAPDHHDRAQLAEGEGEAVATPLDPRLVRHLEYRVKHGGDRNAAWLPLGQPAGRACDRVNQILVDAPARNRPLTGCVV